MTATQMTEGERRSEVGKGPQREASGPEADRERQK